MIREQNVNLQEQEAKLGEQDRIEQEKTDRMETKLEEMKALILGVQEKLSSLSENARINPEVDSNSETWLRLSDFYTQNPSTQLPMLPNCSKTNHRLLRNSLEMNNRTFTLDTSRSKSERSNAAKIKEEITNIMQAQLETKDCKIQHMRILPEGKVKICMEIDGQ